jgi:hypothetical protein
MAKRLRLRFRAAVHETLLHELADRNGVADLVEVLPALPYAQALQEMLRADVLLLLQAANCNEQIPAKLYEYLRAHRPVACLSDASGDTWATLRQAGLSRMASLADVQQIADLLTDCAKGSTSGMLPSPDAVLAADRRSRSAELAALLDGCLQRSAQPV